MIQKTTTLSRSYQVTIPSAMRKTFKLEAGDTIEVIECREGILLKKALSKEEQIKHVFGELEEWRKRLSPEMKEDISRTAGWTAKRCEDELHSATEYKIYIKEKYGI